MLDNAALKDLATKKQLMPDVQRRASRDVKDRHGLSERGACELADLHRSVFQYQKHDQGDDALRKRLRELANERLRFGYRRLNEHIFANLAEAQKNVKDWRIDYNTQRSNTSLSELAPAVYTNLTRGTRPASLEIRKRSAQQALTAT